MNGTVRVDLDALTAAVGMIPDPEVPALSIADLGILRSVTEGEDGVTIIITPTYSGCPAMDFIRGQVAEVAAAFGYSNANVDMVLSPAWTTDWMSEEGKRKLVEFGIAAPLAAGSVPITLTRKIRCPLCESRETELISEFSSTACKALYRCTSCAEPFDYFKEI